MGVPGWTFKNSAGSSSAHAERSCYDPTARNPLYCGAGRTALWELERLSNHFHPSAALFASNLLAGQSISYSGDPLGDFTLARFLDRFVFRNPKQNPEKNKPLTVLGKRNIYRPSGIKAVAPDSVDFRNRDLENVPKDEVFLYKYFNEKVERKGEKVEDDNVSVTSEEFNDYLDKMSGGRQADFDDEDIDFAGGLEEENARKRKAGDDDEDEDAEAGDDEDMEDGVEDDEDNEEDDPCWRVRMTMGSKSLKVTEKKTPMVTSMRKDLAELIPMILMKKDSAKKRKRTTKCRNLHPSKRKGNKRRQSSPSSIQTIWTAYLLMLNNFPISSKRTTMTQV